MKSFSSWSNSGQAMRTTPVSEARASWNALLQFSLCLLSGSHLGFCLIPILLCVAIQPAATFVQLVSPRLHCCIRLGDAQTLRPSTSIVCRVLRKRSCCSVHYCAARMQNRTEPGQDALGPCFIAEQLA